MFFLKGSHLRGPEAETAQGQSSWSTNGHAHRQPSLAPANDGEEHVAAGSTHSTRLAHVGMGNPMASFES